MGNFIYTELTNEAVIWFAENTIYRFIIDTELPLLVGVVEEKDNNVKYLQINLDSPNLNVVLYYKNWQKPSPFVDFDVVKTKISKQFIIVKYYFVCTEKDTYIMFENKKLIEDWLDGLSKDEQDEIKIFESKRIFPKLVSKYVLE